MMLRAGQRVIARATGAASRPVRAPTFALHGRSTRQFWGSDVLSWLRPDAGEKPATSQLDSKKEAATAAEPSTTAATATTADNTAQAIHVSAEDLSRWSADEETDQKAMLRAGGATLRAFSHALATARTPEQLREMWNIVSSREAFVMEDARLVRLSESQEENRRVGTLVMRMVPSEQFAQLRPKKSAGGHRWPSLRHHAPWLLSGSVADVTSGPTVTSTTGDGSASEKEKETDAADVMLLNEAVVVHWVVDVFARLKDHLSVVDLVERYDRDRHARIDALVSAMAAEAEEKTKEGEAQDEDGGDDEVDDEEEAPVEDAGSSEAASSSTTTTPTTTTTRSTTGIKTRDPRPLAWLRHRTRLPPRTHSDYVLALEATEQFATLVRVLRSARARREWCTSIPTLRALLQACVREREGDLARAALEQFSTYAPAVPVPLSQYEAAIRANTIAQPRSARELENALALARRMRADAGYLLHPRIWTTLFNSCVYLSLPARALEVFSASAAHGIAPGQREFLNVFRSACRFGDYDTVVAMVDAWPSACDAGEATEAGKAEREALNSVLWEMLKGQPSAAQVERVLRRMDARAARSGAVLLRRAVARLLEASEGRGTPQERVEAAVVFWESLPRVMVRPGFLLHLLLEHCLDREWEDAAAWLVARATAERVVDVPQPSLTRFMAANDRRGRWRENAALGDRLAAERAPAQLGQLCCELYAMSYQRLEQFDRVLALDQRLALTRTFPASDTLATIVRDAEANR